MKIVAIAGGKGGVGKSNVAVNLALALAQLGKRILLFDAALGMANLDVLLGVQCKGSILDAVDGSMALRDTLEQPAPNVSLLPGCLGVPRLERMSQGQRLRLATDLRAIASDFDVLLVDTAPGLSDGVLFFSGTADEVLVVTTPEPTALSGTYALIKVLATSHDVEAINVLVNRVTEPQQGQQTHSRLNDVCHQFLDRQLGFFGSIPRDSAVEDAVVARKPVVWRSGDSPATRAFRGLADRFDEIFCAPTRDRISNLWKALLPNQSAPTNRPAGR